MPRSKRQILPDVCYHVLNRGNDRRRIFHKQQDYAAFLNVLTQGLSRCDVELFSWCLMPNHWHLVVRPTRADALSNLMRWVTVTHVRRYYQQYPDKTGHLYQGRYKAFAVEEDRHFLTLCRYVEANALRAEMVDDAERWQWSSLNQRLTKAKTPPLSAWPVDRPQGWHQIVNERQTEEELKPIRESLARLRPMGSESWARRIAVSSGSLRTLLPLGRPVKAIEALSPRQRRRRLRESTVPMPLKSE